MTTQLVQTLDAASGWQLTPEQRKTLFDIESKIMAFEMGYQVHQKTLSTLERGVKRQAAIATQLFAKTNQVAAQCDTLNETVELLTQALKVMGEHLEQDPSALVQALEDQLRAVTARLDALEQAQTPPKAPPRRTRKTTAK